MKSFFLSEMSEIIPPSKSEERRDAKTPGEAELFWNQNNLKRSRKHFIRALMKQGET